MTFESIIYLESLIVSLCLKYLAQSSKWRVELGIWEVVFFPVPEKIVYSFLVYYFLNKRVWFTINFLPLFNRVTTVNSKYFNGNFAEAWLFEKFIFELDASSYSFKITCILSRQDDLMVSYLYSFNAFIGINESG